MKQAQQQEKEAEMRVDAFKEDLESKRKEVIAGKTAISHAEDQVASLEYKVSQDEAEGQESIRRAERKRNEKVVEAEDARTHALEAKLEHDKTLADDYVPAQHVQAGFVSGGSNGGQMSAEDFAEYQQRRMEENMSAQELERHQRRKEEEKRLYLSSAGLPPRRRSSLTCTSVV